MELFENTGKLYDKYIIFFSGGKDSIACVLYLLELGVPKSKIELWHHDIDGRGETFMDWECTPAYCRAFARAFGLKIYFSWKEGGFKGEMLRNNSATAPTCFECPDGSLKWVGGNSGRKSTRRKFPQVSADLKVRWCSGYLKIDIGRTAIVNQKRFNGLKILTISGERGQESPARSKYNAWEIDKSDNRYKGTYVQKVSRTYKGLTKVFHKKVVIGKARRHVDRWRPLLDWTEKQVWAIIEKYRVRVHPCYYLGFGRCSCKFCIFGSKNQFASSAMISPAIAKEIISYEQEFGVTIKRNSAVPEQIACGTPYKSITRELALQAVSTVYDQSIIIPAQEDWLLPAGAYGENCGSF